jgi:Arc/MetJ-type ribon-helix-helix transcriptional regulator
MWGSLREQMAELAFSDIPDYIRSMKIDLPPDQKQWIDAQVAAGHFSSVEEAVSVAISDLRTVGTGDLSWMKPYVEEARRSIDADGVIEGEDFLAELDQIIGSLASK